MIGGLLVDTGFFFALHNSRDEYHESAETKKHLLDKWQIILPWPVLYETLNTRFVGLLGAINWFDGLVRSPKTQLLDDSQYRDACRRSVLATAPLGRRLSLVDTVLRSIIEDVNVRVAGVLTFNPKDFADVRRRHRVEML